MASTAGYTTVGQILSQWTAIVGRNMGVCLLAGGFIAILGTVLDLAMGEGGSSLLLSIATFFISYHFSEHILQQEGLMARGVSSRHYASAFGAAFLGTLGIVAGLIVLVLPGLYVAARWSMSSSLVIAEGLTTTQALGQSWQRTAQAAWQVTGAAFVVGLGMLALFALVGLVGGLSETGTSEQMGLVGTAVANAAGAGIQIMTTLFAVAVYACLGQSTGNLDDVFG
ncbi:hypothetical protein [Novosphingobium cyanobacteriorum]|uniref:Glycerophosphoryl diester phosphodiesterase membrane domain-containing protein n=1 Tax=Novosphingobium cyanobacteriorum TaxID=3024215 RepID=A0ABT6CJ42_9SPHN|nr:hypothetical protein [Novosphingobium cyanobacteriorum]MDF8333939.1 hypothetical protein [Novosphingobium cyanobacteriorum]